MFLKQSTYLTPHLLNISPQGGALDMLASDRSKTVQHSIQHVSAVPTTL